MALDNPAGRLYELLSAYKRNADKQRSIVATWAATLGVSEQKVLPELAQVASLIPAVEQTVASLEDETQTGVCKRFIRKWAAPIILYDQHPRAVPSPGAALVDDDGLAALHGLAGYVSVRIADGRVPEDDHRSELRAQVEAIIRDLPDDDSIPEQLASAMNHRLHDVLWAMDHVRIGGPEAVSEATERLLGAVVLYTHPDPSTRKAGPVRRTLDVATKVWVAFKLGPEAKAAIDGWEDILGQLPPG